MTNQLRTRSNNPRGLIMKPLPFFIMFGLVIWLVSELSRAEDAKRQPVCQLADVAQGRLIDRIQVTLVHRPIAKRESIDRRHRWGHRPNLLVDVMYCDSLKSAQIDRCLRLFENLEPVASSDVSFHQSDKPAEFEPPIAELILHYADLTYSKAEVYRTLDCPFVVRIAGQFYQRQREFVLDHRTEAARLFDQLLKLLPSPQAYDVSPEERWIWSRPLDRGIELQWEYVLEDRQEKAEFALEDFRDTMSRQRPLTFWDLQMNVIKPDEFPRCSLEVYGIMGLQPCFNR